MISSENITNYSKIKIPKDQIKLFVLQFILISGIVLFSDQQKYLVLFLYTIASILCILNTKYMLYIFYSSIWISFKLYFEIGSVIVRLSDIIFLFIFISWLINSFYKKTLIISTPKKNDYIIIGFILLCFLSLITSLNRIGTISEIIQIFQLIFLYYLVKSIVDEDTDIRYFMVATVIFGIIDSFWVFSAVLSQGLGGRYIGILKIIPDELPLFIGKKYIYKSHKIVFSVTIIAVCCTYNGQGIIYYFCYYVFFIYPDLFYIKKKIFKPDYGIYNCYYHINYFYFL